MAKRVVGSNLAFSLDGVPFDILAEANFSAKPSKFTNEGIATSGKGFIKKTLINRDLEGVELAVTGADLILLKNIADSTDTVKCSYTRASGDKYRCPECTIDIESDETDSAKATIKVIVIVPWEESLVP
jgi:hypothetical protein